MNKQGIMVFCKELQTQGIWELWYLSRGLIWSSGYQGKDSGGRTVYVMIWRILRCKAGKQSQKFYTWMSCNVGQELKPSPAQRRNKTLTAQRFPQLCLLLSEGILLLNPCFKTISHFIYKSLKVGNQKILLYQMNFKYQVQLFFFFLSYLNTAWSTCLLRETRDYEEWLNARGPGKKHFKAENTG